MRSSTRRHDALVMLSGIASAFLVVSGIQVLSGRIDGVASMVFVLAVFLISMYTDGYLWGLAASLLCVLAVNFAFRSPYFAFNFTLPENLFSALVMLVVSIMTSTLTTRIKLQEQLRMESETEKMRANLLRAVSHDLRTPLTSIYGACSTVIENYDSLAKEQKLKLLGEVCSDAQWLNRMVENLLSVTRFDTGTVSVQSLYEEDPRKNPDAKRIPVVRHIDGHIREIAGGSGSNRGTGGMSTKITAAVVATEAGIDCCVINGENPELLYDLLEGREIGTRFVAKKKG